jgi:hypothetical protein
LELCIFFSLINREDELKENIKNLFIQSIKEEDFSTSFLRLYVLLYKRIQVQEVIQNNLNFSILNLNKSKEEFEKLPITSLNPDISEELKSILKHMQKSMLKTDERKGFFARFHKTRSESIFKILGKGIDPLVFLGIDISPIRDYLIDFTENKALNDIKKRSMVTVFLKRRV